MNKNILVGVGLLILIVVTYVLMRPSANPTSSDVMSEAGGVESTMPVPGENGAPEAIVVPSEAGGPDTASEGGEVTSAMPAPGASDVQEMIVEETQDADSASKNFDVDSFSFGYSMSEIRVTEGDTVTINLTNSAGFHDWVVDEFNAATEQIQAGGQTSVTFVADKAGTYEFYCSVGNHRAQGMVGKLIVEPRA